jgi:hypothetical protein
VFKLEYKERKGIHMSDTCINPALAAAGFRGAPGRRGRGGGSGGGGARAGAGNDALLPIDDAN